VIIELSNNTISNTGLMSQELLTITSVNEQNRTSYFRDIAQR